MKPLLEELLQHQPVVTDGAWGTRLQQLGLMPGECPDGWNLIHPDRVEQVARAYVSAGSRIILTNTFRANRLTLESHGLAQNTADINRKGVDISRRAAAAKALVFASIGPTGKMMITGEVTEQQLQEVFTEQAIALAEGGADALIVETMSDLLEAQIALSAALQTGLPAGVSMVYDSGKDRDRTMMGTTPEEAVEVLAAAGADFVGANCGQGIEGFISICSRMRQRTQLPLWIKPNAGLPELVEAETVYRTTASQFAGFIPDLVSAGAIFIGGCCGTTPDFIRAINRVLAAGAFAGDGANDNN